jgi:hypothetical protein
MGATKPKTFLIAIFHETSAPKTFEVSFKFLQQFSFLISSIVLFAFACFFLCLRFIIHGSAFSSRPQTSEMKITELHKQVQSLELALKEKTASGNSWGNLLLFPKEYLTELPDQEFLPFSIIEPKVHIEKTELLIQFALEYIQDKGNQQGKIIVILKGSGNYFCYPESALQGNNDSFLIDPKAGEFFSMSRYREVRAHFHMQPKSNVDYILEIYIFNKDLKPLFKNQWKIKELKTF